MEPYPILHYPDPRLRLKTRTVERVDDEIRQIFDRMLLTMHEAPGIGLAAPQVDIQKALIVIDISEKKDQPLFLANPKITAKSGHKTFEEGCLSVPGIYAEVERAENITVTALDYDNNPIEITTDGLLAICIQHEIDHLKGKLFVDYLSRIKQQRIRKKMLKMEKITQTA
ncbi:MAG: peptide deformylase [Gammaproteobacteria bacterium]|nr:MAG: peptide deformylase [Gammaproteobacteria bacterium]